MRLFCQPSTFYISNTPLQNKPFLPAPELMAQRSISFNVCIDETFFLGPSFPFHLQVSRFSTLENVLYAVAVRKAPKSIDNDLWFPERLEE